MKVIYFSSVIIILITFFFYKNNSSQNMKKGTTVLGIIEEIYLAEIPNKAKGKPTRIRTRIKLEVKKAYDFQNNPMDISEIDYPTFEGIAALKDEYIVGDKVKILCTTRSGRHIAEIEKVDK